MAIQTKQKFVITCIFSIALIVPAFTLASITDGTIDNVYKYAWSENAGWLNFGCSYCNVHITDSGLTGYAWSENYGWINLNPTNSGIKNDGNGTLSGYAWGENLGWINFSGVIINSNGEFSGVASGDVSGQISFDCPNCKVKTDWRPQRARPACNNSLDDDGDGKIDYPNDPGCDSLSDTDETDPTAAPSGGGGMPSDWLKPPKAPEGEFKVLINNDEKYTNNPVVTLNLFGGPEAVRMAISNNPEFSGRGSTGQIPYQSSYQWNLCQGRDNCPEGEYKVYVQFFASWGKSSGVVSDTIIYQKAKPITEEIKEIPKKITEELKKIPEVIKKIPEVIKKIPAIIKPKPQRIRPEKVPTEELVPKEEALALKGKWRLLSYTLENKPFIKFILAPLPRELQELAEKFPGLGKTFADLGIQRLFDIEKLKTVKFALPGLTERVGLPKGKGVPVAELPTAIKQELPTEIVFAKTGGELIDFNIALAVSEKSELQQKITTIAGKPLQLVVKPDKPVKSVKGYVVFKSKANQPTSLELPLNSLLASLIFANPIFAKLEEEPVRVEEKLVLLEFEYTDPDGDGIYMAEINAPLVVDEYEIITVMDFEDPALARKEISLIMVVEPEGYIYERHGDKETRIPGAIVSLYWLNPETKQYEFWPAKKYQQENPQTTDVRGTYSFLVPEGYYSLKVEAPGYLVYEGKPFQVKEDRGININIELKTKYWWLRVVDWKTILLAVVIILLLYNFYRDKMREKLMRSKNL